MDDARESSETRRAEQVENEDVHDVLTDDQDDTVPDEDRDVEEVLADDEGGTVPDEDRPFGDDPQDLQGDDPASGGS